VAGGRISLLETFVPGNSDISRQKIGDTGVFTSTRVPVTGPEIVSCHVIVGALEFGGSVSL
jgi:hypothetical protein